MSKSMLKLSNIKLIYDSRGIAGLHNLSIEFQKPGIQVIQGPSGCGKTTLFNIISGHLKNDEGTVETFGNRIGIMPKIENINQDLRVLEILVDFCKQNIQVNDHEKAINLAREALMLLEITNEMNKVFSQLSSGQQQRVLLAAAILHKPQIILMDEPFSIVDSNTRKEILKDLKEFTAQQNILVLWVTHQSEDAFEFAQNITLMNYGKIIQTGTAEELYFHPNSLFSANYFDENNIFVCKTKENKVNLPWGEINLPNSLNIEEDKNILAIIRPSAISIATQSDLKAKIKNQTFKGNYYLIETELKGHTIFVVSLRKLSENEVKLSFNTSQIHFLAEI